MLQLALATSYSNPWSLILAKQSSSTFDTSTQTTSATDINMSTDGLKAYVLGGNIIYQYSLSAAWDISTATYTSKSFSVSTQDSQSKAIVFDSTGTKLYMGGAFTGKIFYYTLSTAWDISTATYSGTSIALALPDGDIFFGNSGSLLFIVNNSSKKVKRYSLSTAWDISTATSATPDLDVTAYTTGFAQGGVFFKNDGTRVFYVDYSTGIIYAFNLASAWNFTTPSLESSYDSSGAVVKLFFKDNGTKFIACDGANTLYQYNL